MNDTPPTAPEVEAEATDDPFATLLDDRVLKVRRTEADPAIVDPKARRVLHEAAQAVGLTLSQLLDLIVDGELLAIPPPPADLTESITLGELGKQLHSAAIQVASSERIAWFAELLPKQRIALVVAMRNDGWAAQTISQQFGLPLRSVQQAYTQHADHLGEQVVSVRLNSIAGMIELAAQRAQQGSVAKDDWGTYWRIEKDKLGMLQDLGIVRRAISQVEVTHKLGDAEAAEIKRMVELERKRETRREEIKLIEAEVVDGDAVPDAS